jgi:hypothetical protein
MLTFPSALDPVSVPVAYVPKPVNVVVPFAFAVYVPFWVKLPPIEKVPAGAVSVAPELIVTSPVVDALAPNVFVLFPVTIRFPNALVPVIVPVALCAEEPLSKNVSVLSETSVPLLLYAPETERYGGEATVEEPLIERFVVEALLPMVTVVGNRYIKEPSVLL